MSINVQLLKEKIEKRGLSQSEFSKLIGLDVSTFYRKLKTKGDSFSISEAQRIIKCLHIGKKDAINIFLPQNLHKCE